MARTRNASANTDKTRKLPPAAEPFKFSSDRQPAPERRSGGPRPLTRWLKQHYADEKALARLGQTLILLSAKGHSGALDHLLDRLDGSRTQRHAVAGADLSRADDETLDKLEAILEPISDPGILPDA